MKLRAVLEQITNQSAENSYSILKVSCGITYTMLKQYLILRLRSGCRLLGQLGVVGGLCAFGLLAVLLLFMSNVPAYYWVFVYGLLLLAWHLSRHDSTFLQTLFGKRYLLLFMTDYIFLSIPFIAYLTYRMAWQWIPLLLLLALAIPLIPRRKVSLRLLTFPFLAKGSYEYSRAGRLLLPFWIGLFIASVIGLAIFNNNLVIVVLMIMAVVIGLFIDIPVHPTYLLNYSRLRDLLAMKARHSFLNTAVIIGPFLLIQFLLAPSIKQLGLTIVTGVACSLYFLQVQLLRFICSNNSLARALVFMILSIIFCVSAVFPIAATVSLIVAIIMTLCVRSSLNELFK